MFFSENGKIIDRIEGMFGSVECMSSICKILGGFSPAKPSCSDAYGTGGRRVERGEYICRDWCGGRWAAQVCVSVKLAP